MSDQEKTETMWVKAKDPKRVALYERNAAHPGGEVYVAGSGGFEVGMTQEVRNRIRSRELIEIDQAEAEKLNKELEDQTNAAREEVKRQEELVAAASKTLEQADIKPIATDSQTGAEILSPEDAKKQAETENKDTDNKDTGGLLTTQTTTVDDKPAANAKAKK
jgi:hypothetical protein